MTKSFEESDNIGKIRHLITLMLEEAYRLIKEGLPLDNKLEPEGKRKIADADITKWSVDERERLGQRNKILHLHARLWGKDAPMTEAMATIADTELKIEKQCPAERQEADRPRLDEKDVALVKHYLAKQKDDATTS